MILAACRSEINTEPDHAHLLFVLGRTVAVANAVGETKSGSTNWLQRKISSLSEFHWQAGYEAFSVSKSNVEMVREHIRQQHEHHRRRSFQEEFRALLIKHEIEFDERYVWD